MTELEILVTSEEEVDFSEVDMLFAAGAEF